MLHAYIVSQQTALYRPGKGGGKNIQIGLVGVYTELNYSG
jgi:hypothetical protein